MRRLVIALILVGMMALGTVGAALASGPGEHVKVAGKDRACGYHGNPNGDSLQGQRPPFCAQD